ncbi:MAG: type II secretion system minor pseudopilin GspI [Moraxellaceae bacterium]|jgi:general secretion pathway protein I|nr:type II secretion system minor pseudopilin GspI [Moraxellaceae bacterium]MBP8853412.1 type II secretion system minor pseudopilin GspI [Moraxellaceae bacterium]MBP9045164.1 type II secretion system minor pseudopilin GspI [Moraxellaceae bacterium]MBP9730221.1 type II secretion system minor pseudopilin GspI [Moraxellaceae bacterium]MCC6200517.1 type II secretion system minor pseudopilin GspI [Moraxellaceae bacterium]
MQAKVRGFTLLEVLVALAIFAVASVALLAAQNAQLRTDGRLLDKTMAHWAALNRLAEMQLQGEFPDVGQGQGTVSMGDREWVVTTKVEGTPSQDVRRLTFSVAPKVDEFGEESASVTELTGFLPRLRVSANANQ